MATKDKKPDETPPAELARYSVLSRLKHDGRRYEIGDTIDLDAATAAALTEASPTLLGPI